MKYIDELLNFNIKDKDFENFVISISDRNRVGIKEKSADLIIDSIEKSKNIPFEKVLFAIGIKHVGETVAKKLAKMGIRVIIAGIDMDYRGKPFGPMPNLLAVAEYITKVHAICSHCGNLATHSYRLSVDESTILLGEKDSYEPRCRTCYEMGNILNLK